MAYKVDNVLIMNQYHYGNGHMEEVQEGRSRMTYQNLGTVVILLLVCGFFTYREFVTHKTTLAVLFCIIAVGCLVALIGTLIVTKKDEAKLIKAFKDDYDNKGCELSVMIEASHIRAYKDGKKYADFRRHEILSHYETDRFFVLNLYGEVLVPLKKDAFQEGTLKDIKDYIPDKKEVH